ncbi:MAG TPA: inositol monophosphatase family protein [Planctomycetota bacterium]|nr:inositol monophosphatase family protein [Planctomycetota bacterium]HRR81559.1 inositol monophosphatase family protein [Planctomycetota bacterium]HRT93410.1 inositol monophosphatase family protein [Planctomycetota bacterium]
MTLADTALAAARAAGDIQKRLWGTLLHVDQATRNDVKLEADRLCEQAIVEIIRRDWPHHAILTEEAGALGDDGDCQWIIDPLDGTVSFFYGMPYFCTSVACYRRPTGQAATFPRGLESLGEPLVGVVYAPPTDELFVAEAGRGATLNGKAIRPSTVTTLEESMIGTGFGARPGAVAHFVEQIGRLAPRVRKVRAMGSAAYDLCNVACGRFTGFYEQRLRSWDIAAAAVILREAGAVLDAIETSEAEWNTLAAAPGIYEELRDLVRRP